MKITVCQINASQLESDWDALVSHVQAQQSEVVLLPEMAFSTWFAASKDFDIEIWNDAVEQHQQWSERFHELGAKIVTGTMPINRDGKRLNAAFVWTGDTGLRLVHDKTYVPDEDGFWEASWYQRGKIDFPIVTIDNLNIGFMICTEMWFFQHARDYSKQNIHLLLCPRSTMLKSVPKWLVGGQTAAIVSGAFCLSSNHVGRAGEIELGGHGWVVDPLGTLLATTSEDEPFLTLDIDVAEAEAAKDDYPCYVIDTPL